MDTGTDGSDEVQQHLQEIRAYMPETYQAIQAKAGEIGRLAYQLVRRGLRGQPNSFWAMERGWVKGTPFSLPEIQPDVALAMVQFGSAYVCIFGLPDQGGTHGAH
ncbi:MAG: hypothetical protein ACK5QH_08870 [Rubrivivax sp.]